MAVQTMELSIGEVRGKGWSAAGVHVSLDLSGENQSVARLSASSLTFPAALGSLERLTVTCRNPVVEEPVFACKGADVRGNLGELGAQRLNADVEYNSERGSLSFAIAGLRVAGGVTAMNGRWEETGWRLALDAKSAKLGELRRLAATFVALPEGISLEGNTSMRVELGGGKSLDRIEVDGRVETLTAANAEGTLATDLLALQVRARARLVNGDWHVDADVQSRAGQAYVDPIFIDFGVNPTKAKLVGRWRGNDDTLAIDQLDFDADGIATGNASGEFDFAGAVAVKSLRLDLAAAKFPGTYETLLRPFLSATAVKDLDTSGSVSGVIEMAGGEPAKLDLRLDAVSAESANKRIAMRELQGEVHWQSAERRDAATPAADVHSEVSWKSAHLFGITGGAARIRFAASGADFRILEPTQLPILDGGLAIGTLDVRKLGAPEMSLRFEAELRPISMALLSTAFGWPEFAGTLSGRIPQVTLENNVLAFGGDLEARMFGGRVVVNGLQLKDPLGKYPRLNANVVMRGLDLEAVTGTFEFGSITGRIDGEIRNLELFRWAPVRFDARLYTPANDESRHTISQRAVNNLSNIGGGGGGVTAALSGGFLRFFENFRYDRLGLSCRLENEVCYMDGVEPAGGVAYYIVKGSGIPRIDIKGNAHRVSWSRLLGQLQAIQTSQGPEIR